MFVSNTGFVAKTTYIRYNGKSCVGFGDTDTFVVDKYLEKVLHPRIACLKKINNKNPDICLPTSNHANSQYQNMILQNNSKYYSKCNYKCFYFILFLIHNKNHACKSRSNVPRSCICIIYTIIFRCFVLFKKKLKKNIRICIIWKYVN